MNQVCAITGASGYVGSVLASALASQNRVVELSRKPRSVDAIEWSLESDHDIADRLRTFGVRTLVHAAWDMRSSSPGEIGRICVDGSARLFDQAVRAGVERIVFISTISAFNECRSVYGKAKLSVEGRLGGLPVTPVVLRPGLVYGESPGGVFGGIQARVRKGGVVPLIGRGAEPQYLLHQSTLAAAIVRAVGGDFDRMNGRPITLAHPEPVAFRDLVGGIAGKEGHEARLLSVPWQLLYLGAKAGEFIGVQLPFRSDSIISFVNCDRHPDFTALAELRIEPVRPEFGHRA